MSQRLPETSRAHQEHTFYPQRFDQVPGLIAGTQAPPSAPHTLPPPATLASRPYLPPPSHLEPSFIPQSPQVRPQYTDPSTRQFPAPGRQPVYETSLRESRPIVQAPAPAERPPPNFAYPHPPLFPSKVSYNSANPGTLYEALSPVDYAPHETSAAASLFNEGGYTASSYPPPGQRSQISSAGSHKSSGTSSSGYGSGPMHYPPTLPLEAPNNPNTRVASDRHILTIRQQPIAARACGFGERDRRVIDPPPIIQLSLKDFDPQSPDDVAEIRWPFNIVHCALLSVVPRPSDQDVVTDVTMVQDPNQGNRQSRRLMGTLVSSPFVGTDPDAPESSDENARIGCFFVFPDLSCRQNGLYRLRFTLMKVNIPDMSSEGGQGSVLCSVDSSTFEVFSAKDFPGMRASTALTKELKRQGATVSVKKGKGQRKRGSSISDGSGDDSGDDNDSKAKPRKKRG